MFIIEKTLLEFGEYISQAESSSGVRLHGCVLKKISDVVLWYYVVALKTFDQK